jgi:hypothetical protein
MGKIYFRKRIRNNSIGFFYLFETQNYRDQLRHFQSYKNQKWIIDIGGRSQEPLLGKQNVVMMVVLKGKKLSAGKRADLLYIP